ncbi:MAG: HAD family hydrolase [Candidatus Gracilibacteria bacterium]|nr:HAD family hydrolase [Candidatus Gracilibacteria bacterium]
MKLDQYDTWLFDLDGTLVYSLGLVWECMTNAAKAVGGEITDRKAWNLTIGTGVEKTLAPWVPADRLNEAIELYLSEFHKRTEDGVNMHDGVFDLLQKLQTRKCVMGVVTGKRQYSAEDTLQKKGILSFFDVVIGADTIPFQKPAPQPVQEALQRLEKNAESAVFIGDSEHDITAGRLAGVKTIGVLGGSSTEERLRGAGPDLVVERIADLVRFFEKK